jgi:hypothetical protein
MKRQRRRLATFTPAEEHAWQSAFEYHLNVSKQGQDRACNRAWRDVQKEFPRLKKYDGARP